MAGNNKKANPHSELMRAASDADEAGMVNSLCEAFADDPGLSWVWPDKAARIGRLPSMFRSLVTGAMASGRAYCSKHTEAVSLWRLPGRIHPDEMEVTESYPRFEKSIGEDTRRLSLLGMTLKKHQPTDYAWLYLQFIGVHPAAQGLGLGRAAAIIGVDLARSKGLPVYVEVLSPENVGYYHHIGFETVVEFDVPDGGPHVWAMIHRG